MNRISKSTRVQNCVTFQKSLVYWNKENGAAEVIQLYLIVHRPNRTRHHALLLTPKRMNLLCVLLCNDGAYGLEPSPVASRLSESHRTGQFRGYRPSSRRLHRHWNSHCALLRSRKFRVPLFEQVSITLIIHTQQLKSKFSINTTNST